MSIKARPTGVTIVGFLMLAVSIYWLILGIAYFFGAFWWIWIYGWLGVYAWFYGGLLLLLGFIGLGVSGGLMTGMKQARTFTLIIAVIGLLFAIPSALSGYGIIGMIIYAIIIFYLYRPNVKAYFQV
jgi:hypothetical protein